MRAHANSHALAPPAGPEEATVTPYFGIDPVYGGRYWRYVASWGPAVPTQNDTLYNGTVVISIGNRWEVQRGARVLACWAGGSDDGYVDLAAGV
jgi:hypothetical protein